MLKSLRTALLLVGVLFAAGAFAQPANDDGPSGSADQDPSSRVGRLSFIRGAVSFVPAGENDWVEAQLNRPLITGDKLWTDRDSRAELEIGPATVRIDEQTSFDFLNLDDNTAQIELTEGALNLHVRRLYDNQVYEVDTPTLAFVINRVGEYRVSVEPDGRATIVTVMQGGGDAYGEDGARFRIEEGQSVTFNDSTLRDYYTDSLPQPDDFDRFVDERDSRWERSRSREYVSEDVIGYADLDDNGDWSDVPEYGHVWYPTTVAVGWTPYHYGHWGWVGAYGWTWIDDASWGFAPFHYGRWAYIGNRWGWCPGPRSVRPYYAPALVAFIGGGVSVGVSIGGPVGWFPLGPRDVYFPGYRVSQRYFTQVNVSNTVVNTTVINNYYGNYRNNNVDFGRVAFANRNIAGAVTAVPANAFVSARPVAQSAVAVNRTTFANARVTSYAAVAPTRASLVAANARQGKRPPEAVLDRKIVAASRPAPPVASFASREAILKKNPGQPLERTQLRARPAELPARGPANVANGPNANARGAGPGDRQNVKVVTNSGAPVRTAAPVLTARPRAEGDNRGRRAAAPGMPPNANAPANAANEAAQRGAADRRGNADRTVGNERQPGNANQVQGNQGQRVRSADFVRGNRGNAQDANAPNAQQQQPQQIERGRDANDRGRGRDANGAPNDNSRAVQGQGQGQDRARDAQMQQQRGREQVQQQQNLQREQAQQQNQQREREQAQQQNQQREQMQRQRDQQAQQQNQQREREQAQQQNQQREQMQRQRDQQAQQQNQQREREQAQQQNQQREQMQRQRDQQAQQQNQQREREQAQQQNQQREQMQRQRDAQQQQQQQQQQQREQAQQQREQQIQQQREQMQRQRDAQQQQQQQQREQAQRQQPQNQQPPPQRQQPPQNQNRSDNRGKDDKKKKKDDDDGG